MAVGQGPLVPVAVRCSSHQTDCWEVHLSISGMVNVDTHPFLWLFDAIFNILTHNLRGELGNEADAVPIPSGNPGRLQAEVSARPSRATRSATHWDSPSRHPGGLAASIGIDRSSLLFHVQRCMALDALTLGLDRKTWCPPNWVPLATLQQCEMALPWRQPFACQCIACTSW